jgi:Gpi18-like mannosyltransferase
MKITKKYKSFLPFLILFLGFFLRVKLLPYKTHWSDMYFWKDWAEGIIEVGTKNFYNEYNSDYLPFYPLVLGFIKRLYNALAVLKIIPIHHFYKLPAVIFDLLLGGLIFRILKEKLGVYKGVLFLCLFLFNPAIFANSSMWGQVDVVGTFFTVLSLFFFFKKHYFFSGAALGFSLCTKPLYILIAPVFLIAYFKRKPQKSKIFKDLFLLASGAAFFGWLITSVFVDLSQQSVLLKIFQPFVFLFKRYRLISNRYPYSSVNAFNFWGLVEEKFWVSDLRIFAGLQVHTWGLVLTGGLLLLILGRYLYKNKKDMFEQTMICLTLIFLAAFLFMTRMHERHLFYVFPFLLLSAYKKRKYLFAYFVLSLIYLANLHFGLEYYYQADVYVFSMVFIRLLSFINLAVFGWLLYDFFKQKDNEN